VLNVAMLWIIAECRSIIREHG